MKGAGRLMAGLLLLFDGHLKHGPAKLARRRRHRHCFILRDPPCVRFRHCHRTSSVDLGHDACWVCIVRHMGGVSSSFTSFLLLLLLLSLLLLALLLRRSSLGRLVRLLLLWRLAVFQLLLRIRNPVLDCESAYAGPSTLPHHRHSLRSCRANTVRIIELRYVTSPESFPPTLNACPTSTLPPNWGSRPRISCTWYMI